MPVNHKKAGQFLADAVSKCGAQWGHNPPEKWWPHSQGDRSVPAQAIAMEWADADGLGTQGAPIWVSTCYAKNAGMQQSVLHNKYGVYFPTANRTYAPRGNRRFDSRQYVVDFSLWSAADDARSDNKLIMESEAREDFFVGSEVINENGYAYDFFKIVWLPSPRRLFVCFVRDANDRVILQTSLNKIATPSAHLIKKDELVVYILAPQQGQKNDYSVGIWNTKAKRLDWQTAPVALP